MDILNFQSEQPSITDAFPGGSHDRVAHAIYNYILADHDCKVIGLDGEFGSGKSSILKMLEAKIKNSDQPYRFWVFDCEQNYQGSIKSNFIELFTNEILADLDSRKDKELIESVVRNKSIALGRHLSYTKKTKSHVSPWAIALLSSLFLSSTFLKDGLSILRAKPPETPGSWTWLLYLVFIASPAIVLGAAWLKNKKSDWSMLTLFKGSSDDIVNETVDVSKEVSPLDLKRTLKSHLDAVRKYRYIIVIDNLDRLPKDVLRSVWSDLEIFTSVTDSQELSLIVPFCSTKVAKYLGSDEVSNYDSKDFIAKKFPVVFRAPPVITSGWKEAFSKLWVESFGSGYTMEAQHCSALLQRHSPMNKRLVTPRLQKRFINDIATTLLVTSGSPNILCVAAYILLCKYNIMSIEKVLAKEKVPNIDFLPEGSSAEKVLEQLSDLEIDRTKLLLSKIFGDDMSTGWSVQFLQIHFQTSPDIAMAELIDIPLAHSIETVDCNRLNELSTIFGFSDSFMKLLDGDVNLLYLYEVLCKSHQTKDHGWNVDLIAILNDKLKGNADIKRELADQKYFDSLTYLIKLGLDKELFNSKIAALSDEFDKTIKRNFNSNTEKEIKDLIFEYDGYLSSLQTSPRKISVDSAEVLFHCLGPNIKLSTLKTSDITLTEKGETDAVRQILSSNTITFSKTPLDEKSWLNCLSHVFNHRKMAGRELQFGLDENEATTVISALAGNYNVPRYWASVVLARTITPTMVSVVASVIPSLEDTFSKVAAGIILIRAKNIVELAKYPKVSEAMAENHTIVDLLVRTTVTFDDLMTAISDAHSRALISTILVRMIRAKAISTLWMNYFIESFGLISESLAAAGLPSEELLQWLTDGRWGFDNQKIAVDNIDPALISSLFAAESNFLPELKKRITQIYTSESANEEVWSAVLTSKNQNHTVILDYLRTHNHALTNAQTARVAVLGTMTPATHTLPFTPIATAIEERIKQVINLFDLNSKRIFGSELRNLTLSNDANPEGVVYLLARYGYLIPDIRPVNIAEAGVLLKILEHLSKNEDSNMEVISLYESRAEQLCDVTIEGDLKESFVELVTQMKLRMPQLYARLSRKKAFKDVFSELAKKITS